MSDIVQWMSEQSPEKLREIMQGHPKHTDEYRLAELELRRKEEEQAKKDAESAAQIETQRHQEAIALSREEIEASHYSNRLAILAIGVAVVALAVAILGWMFPREPLATGHSVSAGPQLSVPPQSNTTVSVSLPATNGVISTTSLPATVSKP